MVTKAFIEVHASWTDGIGGLTITAMATILDCAQETPEADALFVKRAAQFVDGWNKVALADRGELLQQMIAKGLWSNPHRYLSRATTVYTGRMQSAIRQRFSQRAEPTLETIEAYLSDILSQVSYEVPDSSPKAESPTLAQIMPWLDEPGIDG